MDKLERMILAYVAEHPGTSEDIISRQVGVPDMSLYRPLCNLVRIGYLRKHGFSYYRIRG